jgi:hypothetical protein
LVAHSDKPDVVLTSGKWITGVEITEAVSEQYAAYSALAEREFPDVFLQPGHFRWGAPKKTLEEMRQLLRQTEMTFDGWVGNSVEREWASFVLGLVNHKQRKLANAEFSKFQRNWLAIYDNLPLPNVHLGQAIAILSPLLEEHWSVEPHFHCIFIEHGPVVARITADTSEQLALNDIWG